MKSYAKINLFLKIIGKDTRYHQLISRFALCRAIYDELEWIDAPSGWSGGLYLQSDFVCDKNILYDVYELVSSRYDSVKSHFDRYGIKLRKNIPNHSGLGASGSNAATMMRMIDEDVCSLPDMMDMAARISADCGFFASGCECANVRGYGQIIEPFDSECVHIANSGASDCSASGVSDCCASGGVSDCSASDLVRICLNLTQISCDTTSVFRQFASGDFDFGASRELGEYLATLSNANLARFALSSDTFIINDLSRACATLYPSMQKYFDTKWILSGSGGSVFCYA